MADTKVEYNNVERRSGAVGLGNSKNGLWKYGKGCHTA